MVFIQHTLYETVNQSKLSIGVDGQLKIFNWNFIAVYASVDTHTHRYYWAFVCVINHIQEKLVTLGKIHNIFCAHFQSCESRVNCINLGWQLNRCCNHDWNAWNSNFQFKLEGIYVQTLSIWLNYSNLSNLIACVYTVLCMYIYK